MNGWPAVLHAIAGAAPRSGAAEDEARVFQTFLPTARFVQALDPSFLLVLGDRGAGKTHLFRLLEEGGVDALLRVPEAGRRDGDVPYVATIGDRDWPEPMVTAAVLRGADDVTAHAFWLGLLARKLAADKTSRGMLPELPDLPRAVVDPGAVPSSWLPETVRHAEGLLRALGQLDDALQRADRTLIVCHDALEHLVPSYEDLFPPLRALLGFWYGQWRRWRRIRPKIFLRVDVFNARALAFPDASKFFRGYAIDLAWDRDDLYRMWIKRLLNHPDRSAASWLRGLRPRIETVEIGRLGRYPLRVGEEYLRPVMTSLVGHYMGANPRKGDSYFWVPNHIQDAQGRMAPRSFLRLMAEAAASGLRDGVPESGNPLKPVHFTAALERASRERIAELLEDDPWMTALPDALQGLLVPTERDEIGDRLERAAWTGGAPPHPEPEVLLEHLRERGIVERRTDGRYSVPDLYLFGLRMKRKGGPRRAG